VGLRSYRPQETEVTHAQLLASNAHALAGLLKLDWH